MKLEKIFLLLGVSLLLTTNSYSQTACSDCYAIKRPNCENRCNGSATRVAFSSCVDTCVSSSCGKYCKNAPTTTNSSSSASDTQSYADPTLSEFSPFPNVSGDCGKCLRNATARLCHSKCPYDQVEDVIACRKSCAKLECSSSCQLPNEERNSDNEKPPTVRDCAECKREGESICRGKCDGLKDQPGYMACVVSCVEDRCFNKCNPE